MKSKTDRPAHPPSHITIDDIRKVKGYEHLTDAEAEKILFSLKQYASILIQYISKSKKP